MKICHFWPNYSQGDNASEPFEFNDIPGDYSRQMVHNLLTPVCRDHPGRIPNRLAHLDHIAWGKALNFLLSQQLKKHQ